MTADDSQLILWCREGREEGYRQLLAATVTFLRRLVRALHLEVELAGVYGTDDPAITGYLAGLLAIIGGDSFAGDLHPDFTGAILDINGTIWSNFIPARLLELVLAFIWQKPVRRLWLSRLKVKIKLKHSCNELR